MCLVSFAFQVSDRYPLVLVGNRDEYHARPSADAEWWQDKTHILAGRDLLAGGTWLAASKTAHLAVVTNRPDVPPPDDDALSRGDLVTGALCPEEFSLRGLEETHHQYGGFSLFMANRETLTLLSGGNGTGFERHSLQPGIYGISNTPIEQPWPKVGWLNTEVRKLLSADEPDPRAFLELLARRESVPAAAGHGVPATPFVLGEDYGTRCSTVAMIRADGSGIFLERRFGPGGIELGESEFTLGLG